MALLGTKELVPVPFDKVVASADTTTPAGSEQIKSVAKSMCFYAESEQSAGTGPGAAYQAGVRGQFEGAGEFKAAFDHDDYEAFDGLGRAAIFHRNKDEAVVTVLEEAGSAFSIGVYHHPDTTREDLIAVARRVHKRL